MNGFVHDTTGPRLFILRDQFLNNVLLPAIIHNDDKSSYRALLLQLFHLVSLCLNMATELIGICFLLCLRGRHETIQFLQFMDDQNMFSLQRNVSALMVRKNRLLLIGGSNSVKLVVQSWHPVPL
jgi:hypothetical protein